MTVKTMFRALAVTLMLALVFSFGAFAAEDTVLTETSGDNDVILSAPVEGDTAADTAADTTADTTADTAEAAPEIGETSTETTGVASTETTGEAEEEEEEEEKGLSTGDIISIAIVLVIVIAAAVYCIKNKEKVAKFFREVKSELKKIVWTPWKQVKKNTFVVLVIVLVCAAIIALCDYAFSLGITSLSDVIRG